MGVRKKGCDLPMADLYMHHKFALDVSKSLGMTIDQTLLLIGAQGPDPLYFNIFSKNGDVSRRLADLMHEEKIDQMVGFLVQKAGISQDPSLLSYVIGFISHVILDQTIHPYVYHYSGCYEKRQPKFGHHRGLHMRFERRIDLVMIERDTKLKARKFPIRKRALPRATIPDNILELVGDLSKTIYDIPDGKNFYGVGYKRMRNVIGLGAQDQTGLKRLLYKILDLFNTRHELFLSDFSFAAPTDGIDYLNQRHQPWEHPVTGVVSTSSVLDLYDIAKKRFLVLIDSLTDCLYGGRCEGIVSVLENRSLNTGIMLDKPQTMSHFSLFMTSNLRIDRKL